MHLPELRFGEITSKLPIIQGGMGVGISLSGLASAVAREGGVGVIAAVMIGMNEPDIRKNFVQANLRALKREIRKAREKASGVLGVNIMVALNHFSDMVRTSINEGIDIIFSGAGLPLDLPKYLPKDSKTSLVPIVSSARAARILCKKWLSRFDRLPDGFVVEGPKAGGHLGFKPDELDNPANTLENLVRDVIDETMPMGERYGVSIPVVAAGGIYTGEDICRFLKLGASGVQLGTRFVTTHECDADNAFKQSYIDAKEEDMIIIKSPVGMPGRAIDNQFLKDAREGKKKPFSCPYHCLMTCDRKNTPYCIAQALLNAKKGILSNGFAFAGKNAFRADRIISVKELIATLKQEYDQACAKVVSNLTSAESKTAASGI